MILFGALAAAASTVSGQTTTLPLAWEQTKYFQYNIENVTVTPGTTAGAVKVKAIFSVSNPFQGNEWDIKTAAPFQAAGAALTLDIGWNPKSDFTNTGSTGATLAPLAGTALGAGVAIPVQVRNLQTTASTACVAIDDCPGVSFVGRKVYFVTREVTPVPGATAGRVALEGKPLCKDLPNCPDPIVTNSGTTTYANIPVKSATADFAIPASSSTTAVVANQRRQVVDIAKCKGCHDDQKHGDVVVPRLSLHGANRNENLDLCVTCHNPNQTDVPYRYLSTADARIGGPETPIDFKVMVHSIHAGGFRKAPYVVIGRNSSINDYSGVRFPAELRKSCLKCHVTDASGKGSFELPLKSTVLGTTINSQSVYQVATGQMRSIDVDPANDTKITPTAATCSACHDNSEVRSHMIRTGGASFATTQDKIGTIVKERCATCHGPGKDKDVRKVHELGSGSGSGSSSSSSGSSSSSSRRD
ncbi:MAG: multiheme c-type cytochrome [Betaproteobacteria bacterium]